MMADFVQVSYRLLVPTMLLLLLDVVVLLSSIFQALTLFFSASMRLLYLTITYWTLLKPSSHVFDSV